MKPGRTNITPRPPRTGEGPRRSVASSRSQRSASVVLRRPSTLAIAIGVVLVLLVIAFAYFSLWNRPTTSAPTPAVSVKHMGDVTLSAQIAPDRTGIWGHDIVAITVGGGNFAHAADVHFTVQNTFDPRSKPFDIDATLEEGNWVAEFDPAKSGVGDYTIVAHGTNAAGDTFSEELRYTCTITFEPANEIHLGGGDYDVAPGMAGLKVLRIQDVFGNGVDNYPRYLDHTEQMVREFQAANHLPVTGIVDHATWLALGLDPMEWYTLSAYVSPSTVGSHATNSERIEAMIAQAQKYLGDTYIWDAAGAPGQGIDCAGLVIQGLYAAGYNPGILNPVTHAATTWGDHDAANLYSYCNLKEVDPAHMNRGDLVFYGKDGSVDHVAIYLGNNQVIEAHPKGVRIEAADYRPIMGARRIFG